MQAYFFIAILRRIYADLYSVLVSRTSREIAEKLTFIKAKIL